MSLTVFSAKNYSAKLKVTVQATGKLGFTSETAKSLNLSPDTYIKIASDNGSADSLYMIICQNPDEDGFKVNRISGYYSLPTSVLLTELGIDYKMKTVIYDLSRDSSLDIEAGGIVYKMNKREKQRKKEVPMK